MARILCFVVGQIPGELLCQGLATKIISRSLRVRPVILGEARLGCREIVGHGGIGTGDHDFFDRIRCKERAGSAEPLTIVLESLQDKANAIAQAQQAGLLSSRYAPADLLGLILHVSMLWASATPEFEVLISRQSRPHRRKVVTDAVTGLLAQ